MGNRNGIASLRAGKNINTNTKQRSQLINLLTRTAELVEMSDQSYLFWLPRQLLQQISAPPLPPLFIFPTILGVVLALLWKNYHLVNCLSRITNPTHRETRTRSTFSDLKGSGGEGVKKIWGEGGGSFC